MNCNIYNSEPKDFTFTFGDSNKVSINSPVCVPLEQCNHYREIAHQICESCKIPCFVESEFMRKLKTFYDEQNDATHDEAMRISLEKLNIQNEDISENCHFILNSIGRDKETERVNSESNNDMFAEKYHTLIHSGLLTQTIINLEYFFSITVNEMITSRDKALDALRLKQLTEMTAAIESIGTTVNEDDINALSIKQFQEAEDLQNQWNKSISYLKNDQKHEFHDWIDKVYEDFQRGDSELLSTRLRSYSTISTNANAIENSYDECEEICPDTSRMEESFTINLGAQLKTTHNLRLISMDILDLCRSNRSYNGNPSNHISAHRLQTAMSLYSNSLSAMVLLVDNRINSFSGIKLEFANICSRSTEFHFAGLENQIEDIRTKIFKNQMQPNNAVTLENGDFFITKHSNLSECHVVYHLVTDDSLGSSDINSRHPVILGLRNILKIAHLNDIGTISIPLLLIHEMTEDITLQWCLKRAELVMKCVKGFMIEMASLSSGTDDNRTVQFIVPKGISDDLFSSLSSMLPSIFRLSNPLILKTIN